MLRRLASDSVVYGLAIAITRFLQVLLVPVYTRLFSPEDFGVVGIVTTVMTFLNILVVLALDSAAGRWYWDSGEEHHRKRVIASWFWCQLGAAIVLALAVALAAGPVVRVMGWDLRVIPAVSYAAASLPFLAVTVVLSNLLRYRQRPWVLFGFSLVNALVTVGLTLGCVLTLKQGIQGIYLAQCGSAMLMCAAGVVLLRDWISLRHFDPALLRQMLRFALPLIPASVSFWVVGSSDRLFVEHYAGMGALGLYQFASMLALAVSLLTFAFQQAWGPFAMSIHHRPDAPAVYAKVLLAYSTVTTVCCVGLGLVAPEAVWLLASPGYEPAAALIGVLAFGYAFVGLGYIAVTGLTILKVSTATGMAILWASILNVALNLLLVPRYGGEGAALAFALAQASVPLYLFRVAQGRYFIPYDFWRTGAIFAAGLGVVGLANWLAVPAGWLPLAVKAMIWVVFTTTLVWLLFPEAVRHLTHRDRVL